MPREPPPPREFRTVPPVRGHPGTTHTPARHCAPSCCSAAVMAGSRRVQSARSSTTLRHQNRPAARHWPAWLLVVLAGHAPGGGEVDKHRCTAGHDLLHFAGCPGLPALHTDAACLATGANGDGLACSPSHCQQVLLLKGAGHQPGKSVLPTMQGQAPDRMDRRHQQGQQRACAVNAGLLAQHPHQPDHGGKHRERHGVAEACPSRPPGEAASAPAPVTNWPPDRARPYPRPMAAKISQRLQGGQSHRPGPARHP
jgi:hypothetical protein